MNSIIIGMKFKYVPSKSPNSKSFDGESFFKDKNNIMEDDIITVKLVDEHFLGISVNRSRKINKVNKDSFMRMANAKMLEVV